MLRRAFAIIFVLLLSQTPVLAQGAPAAPAERNEAGIVDLIEGDVTVTGADRRARVLKRNDALFEGDTILTAADGELHANLTDGGVIAVRPNTQLRITRYQANGAAGDTSIFNLVKGSFRSITGWIARTNPAGYLIRTPTSTLGVRGTDHEPLVIPPGAAEGEPGTYDRVHAGTSFIRGANGTVDVPAGRSGFFAHHGRERPRVLENIPPFFRPARNERLLEGRHEQVRQVLEQKRGERRRFVEQRRPQGQEMRNGVPSRKADDNQAVRASQSQRPDRAAVGERAAEAREQAQGRREAAQSRREQQSTERKALRDARQHERREQR